MLYIRCS